MEQSKSNIYVLMKTQRYVTGKHTGVRIVTWRLYQWKAHVSTNEKHGDVPMVTSQICQWKERKCTKSNYTDVPLESTCMFQWKTLKCSNGKQRCAMCQ